MSLHKKHILVTSGPTRADIDAVRFISNRSSGRLGCAIVTEALQRGARVTMVAGPESALPPDPHESLQVLNVVTVDDVMATMERALRSPDAPEAVVHAMAVLDYVPADTAGGKTPSGRDEWSIRLVRTPKVIHHVREWCPRGLLVQFKLEVGVADEELREIALSSLARNRSDLVVANDLARICEGRHPALVLDAEGRVLARPGTKAEIARSLCDELAARL